MADDNIELMLRHWLETLSLRLDKMSDQLECLRDQKIVVQTLQEKTSTLQNKTDEIWNKVHELEIDMKRRAEVNKTITTPIIQKIIWALICTIFFANAGYLVKNINVKSQKEFAAMLKKDVNKQLI
jgi:hypothetical protein